MLDVDDTIVAIASALGGDRGIVRLSGRDIASCLHQFFSDGQGDAWRDGRTNKRIAGHVQLDEPLGALPCDLHYWPTKRSYTCQPTAEFHTFGNGVVLNRLVERCCGAGARLAQPGEFTMRAFLAGRLDLTQAEAVLGVIDAVDHRTLTQSLAQMAGGLSRPLNELRNTLLDLCADLEAGLDFVEEDIAFIAPQQVHDHLAQSLDIVQRTQSQMHGRDRGDTLPRVVLVGRPNAGKSSIWNALVAQAQAIVSDHAGTTRDYLVGIVRDARLRFELVDTAGIDHGTDALPRAMAEKTDDQTAAAELLLLCIPADRPLSDWEQGQLAADVDNRIVVLTKCDQRLPTSHPDSDVRTSVIDGTGLNELRSLCVEHLLDRTANTAVASTATRCRDSLRGAADALHRAQSVNAAEGGDELVSAEIRLALEHLGRVVGTVYTDDILDRVFSRFCIGK